MFFNTICDKLQNEHNEDFILSVYLIGIKQVFGEYLSVKYVTGSSSSFENLKNFLGNFLGNVSYNFHFLKEYCRK